MSNDRDYQTATMAAPAQETLGSMLNRLSSVISHTEEHVAVSRKINSTTREAMQRLGFINDGPLGADGAQVGGSTDQKEASKPTLLQMLDSLINQLGNTNHQLMLTNEQNNNLRSALEGQL